MVSFQVKKPKQMFSYKECDYNSEHKKDGLSTFNKFRMQLFTYFCLLGGEKRIRVFCFIFIFASFFKIKHVIGFILWESKQKGE